MKIYKAKYKDRNGRQQESKKWYVDFFCHNKYRHRIPAFADKRLSETMGRNIQALVNCRIAGQDPDEKLSQWIETIPDDLLRKFVEWGLVDGQRAVFTKPLTEHIKDYEIILRSRARSKDYNYATRQRNRLLRICKQCRFVYLRDITRSAVECYSGRLKKRYSDTTRGHYLSALVSFLNWAKRDRRIIRNPLEYLNIPDRDSEEKGILEPEQFVHLVRTTFEKNMLIGRITGTERAVLYILAGTTGLRRKELLNIRWSDIYLSGRAFVRVRASISKNAKEAQQPLTPAIAAILQAVKAQARANDIDRVFSGLSKWINTAELIREDLAVAKIEPTDKDGNEICFHSLRNSYISYLANSQTPAKVVQKLARHSDPRLTFNTYARTLENAEQEAVTFLPILGNFVFDTSLHKTGIKQDISIDSHRQRNCDNTQKTAFIADNKIPPRGVEPLSDNSQVNINKQLTKNKNSVFDNGLHSLCAGDSDLEEIILAWPGLSDSVKKQILALIEKGKNETDACEKI